MNPQAKIGVFACECGGEISCILDIKKLLNKAAREEDVTLTTRLPYGCTPDGTAAIQHSIASGMVNRVVILGCSPRLMEKRFQKVCGEAGLNPFLLEMVNLRDQCAWIHRSEPGFANIKAWDLVRGGIARARYLDPVNPVRTTIHPQVAVIGGGISGMTSALYFSDQGIKVKLIERENDLGGNALKPGCAIPGNNGCEAVAKELSERVRKSDHIEVLTRAEPVAVQGSYGNYKIKLKTARRTRKIKCGAVVLAVGAEEFTPAGYHGYGENPKVITQSEMRQKLSDDAELWGVKNVVMIQCVGARNSHRPYCGRTCCLTAVQNATYLKTRHPDISVTVLHRDMPVEPGPDRITLNNAHDLGVRFLRLNQDTPPEVTVPEVVVQPDNGRRVRIPYDLVVLSTPMIPRESSKDLARAFQVCTDRFGFFPDTLPNLKPHQYSQPCIRSVGCAHWPCTHEEAAHQAYSRSAGLASIIGQREVISGSATAIVRAEICRGCGTCLEWCPFDIPVLKAGFGENRVCFIDPFLCRGCGSCIVHCPTGAATIANLDDERFYHILDAVLSDRKDTVLKVIGFLCEWSGYAAADLAGKQKKPLPPEVIPIRVPCAGRVSTALVLQAFAAGADGVIISACEKGDCHYVGGNSNCAAIVDDTVNLLGLLGIEDTRFRLIHVGPENVDGFSKALDDFVFDVKKLEGKVPGPVHARVDNQVNRM